jgi:DNA-directed RNA polymerase III subunit RPC5
MVSWSSIFNPSNDGSFFHLPAKILSFNNLMEMLSDPQLSIEKVLRNLALCGVMLRGNWTLQSEVLYPPEYVSVINGISSELMCRGRDYILHKIMKNELAFLNRQKISVITQLPYEETREVLESVAHLKVTEKRSKIWDLLKPADFDFEKRHPEIVQRQEIFWKAQEEKFTEMEQEKNEKRTRKRSVRETKA